MALTAAPPSPRAWRLILVALAALWAVAMSWHYRYDFPADKYTYLKVDFIAFQTAAAMVANGNAEHLYDFRREAIDITVDRAAGVPGFAADDLTVVRILPGDPFVKAAAALDFPGDHPPVYVYNPVYAMAFMPLLKLPWNRAALLVDFACLFTFMATLLLFAQRLVVSQTVRAKIVCAAAPLILCTIAFPVRFDLLCGQITPLVAAALLSAAYSFSSPAARAAHGVAIALIAGMKILPLLVIVWLVGSRRKEEAIAATLTTIVVALLTVIFFGNIVGPWRSIAAAMGEGTRAWVYNQSLESLLGRFLLPLNFAGGWESFAPPQARIIAALPGVAAFCAWGFLAWKCWQRRTSSADLLAALMTLFAFATPLAWSHYALYCFPGLALLIIAPTARWQRILATALAACIIIDPALAQEMFAWLRDLVGVAPASIIVKAAIALPTIAAVALFCTLLSAASSSLRRAPSA